MPEINRVDFRYEPVSGDLLTDGFRMAFYTERLEDVQATLQYLCLVFDVANDITGEIKFSAADDEPPVLSGLRYRDPTIRANVGDPFPKRRVELWPSPP